MSISPHTVIKWTFKYMHRIQTFPKTVHWLLVSNSHAEARESKIIREYNIAGVIVSTGLYQEN